MKLLSWNVNGLRAVHRKGFFLPWMEQEDADMFVAKYLLPGLKKMLAGFAGKSNAYENALATIRDVLADRHIREKGGSDER